MSPSPHPFEQSNTHIACLLGAPAVTEQAAKGKTLSFTTTASGSVTWSEARADAQPQGGAAAAATKPTAGKVLMWCCSW
jgi:hypothetical protein